MSLVGGLVSFVIIWTVVLFMVLPWGNQPVDEPEPGHAASAPANPRIGLKFLITSAISSVLFLIFYVVVEFRLLTL